MDSTVPPRVLTEAEEATKILAQLTLAMRQSLNAGHEVQLNRLSGWLIPTSLILTTNMWLNEAEKFLRRTHGDTPPQDPDHDCRDGE